MAVKYPPEEPAVDPEELAPLVARLRKDLRAAAATLREEEARYLVDLYYQLQPLRITCGNEKRAEGDAPNLLIGHLHESLFTLERMLPRVMDVYTDQHLVTRWAKSQYGVGPILAAGFFAHIDLRRAETAGSIWRFAGLDPSRKWEKKTKRPWNARLKVLCWKLGVSFSKFQNRPACVYGKLLAQRKAFEVERDEAGANAAIAAETLAAKKIRDADTRKTYEAGHLPRGRLQLRAERYAVKRFLSHYHQVGRESLGLPVPKPYIFNHPGHVHCIAPPNWPMK